MDMEVVKRFRRRLQDMENRVAGLETEMTILQTLLPEYEQLRRDLVELRAALDVLSNGAPGDPDEHFANPS